MGENADTVILLLSEFVSGKINRQEFSLSLDKEYEKTEKKLLVLQNNLVAQQTIIDGYGIAVNKYITEIDELKGKLSDAGIQTNKWKDKYYELLNSKISLFEAIQVAHKAMIEKPNSIKLLDTYYWNSEDPEVKFYLNACKHIEEHKIIKRLLLLINYI